MLQSASLTNQSLNHNTNLEIDQLKHLVLQNCFIFLFLHIVKIFLFSLQNELMLIPFVCVLISYGKQAKCNIYIYIYLYHPGECAENQFKCSDYTCIDAGKRCDGEYDCPDYTDEHTCGKKKH